MIRSNLGRCAEPLFAWMARQGAKRYIAGSSIEHAIAVCHRAMPVHSRFIVCPWDRPGDTPEAVFQSYAEAINTLNVNPLDCHLSVKFPSLGFDRGRLYALLEAGQPRGIRIHLDALTPESVEPTIRALRALRGRFSNIGYTVPGRWKRSCSDLPHLLDLAIPLRIVKGQLPDRHGGELPLRAGFLALITTLQKSRASVGVATHDTSLAGKALTILTEANVRCEVEHLYRMRAIPTEIHRAIPRRFYVPYGHGYPPYDVYAAVRRPGIALRLALDVMRGICTYPARRPSSEWPGISSTSEACTSPPRPGLAPR